MPLQPSLAVEGTSCGGRCHPCSSMSLYTLPSGLTSSPLRCPHHHMQLVPLIRFVLSLSPPLGTTALVSVTVDTSTHPPFRHDTCCWVFLFSFSFVLSFLFISFLDSTYSRIIFLHLTYFTWHNMLTVHPCGCLW